MMSGQAFQLASAAAASAAATAAGGGDFFDVGMAWRALLAASPMRK